MSVTLNLSPEVESGLLALAQERGVSLTEYLEEIATKEAARQQGRIASSGEEKAREFLAWADSFPETPALSDEAVSRASMYPDRW